MSNAMCTIAIVELQQRQVNMPVLCKTFLFLESDYIEVDDLI